MALQLKLSCDNDKKDTGPTLIHSTGVENYKIPPEVIRILQETLTNDHLSDHDDGVLCQESPQRIVEILSQHGFSVQDENDQDDKTIWTITQGDHSGGGAEGGNDEPAQPSDPPATDDNEAERAGDGGNEEPAADDEGEGDQQEEEQEKEE